MNVGTLCSSLKGRGCSRAVKPSLSDPVGFSPQKTLRHSTALHVPNGSHTGARLATRSLSLIWARKHRVLPILPRMGKFGSSWLSQRRWRRVRSPRPYQRMAIWNEGTPFRDFGPHTRRKAPAEARARFSEESCRKSQDWDYCSTAGHYRQARCNSRNLLSVAIALPVVNHLPSKIGS